MPDKRKLINSNNPDAQFPKDSGHGKLVQLVFVNHMSNLKKIYCSVSFARQYILHAFYSEIYMFLMNLVKQAFSKQCLLFFLISQQKNMLWALKETVSVRRFF